MSQLQQPVNTHQHAYYNEYISLLGSWASSYNWWFSLSALQVVFCTLVLHRFVWSQLIFSNFAVKESSLLLCFLEWSQDIYLHLPWLYSQCMWCHSTSHFCALHTTALMVWFSSFFWNIYCFIFFTNAPSLSSPYFELSKLICCILVTFFFWFILILTKRIDVQEFSPHSNLLFPGQKEFF